VIRRGLWSCCHKWARWVWRFDDTGWRLARSRAASATLMLALSWSSAEPASAAPPLGSTLETAAAPPAASASASRAEEIAELTRQRRAIRSELPATMTVVGGLALFFAPLGYELSNLCALGESEGACDDRDAVQSQMVVIGVAGAVVAVSGVAWLLHNAGERRKLDERIRALRAERSGAMSWSVAGNRERVGIQLRVRW
jgi:hypothetical protein